jgi:hypothetical protein
MMTVGSNRLHEVCELGFGELAQAGLELAGEDELERDLLSFRLLEFSGADVEQGVVLGVHETGLLIVVVVV